MYPTQLNKHYRIISLSLEDSVNAPNGRAITEINFYRRDSNYTAEIKPDSIKLFSRDDSGHKDVELAEFDFKTKKVNWYLDHCCEKKSVMQSVNVNAYSLEDAHETDRVFLCFACDYQKLPDNFWNRGIISFQGRDYSRRLSKTLSKSIPKIMQEFYDSCKPDPMDTSKPL